MHAETLVTPRDLIDPPGPITYNFNQVDRVAGWTDHDPSYQPRRSTGPPVEAPKADDVFAALRELAIASAEPVAARAVSDEAVRSPAVAAGTPRRAKEWQEEPKQTAPRHALIAKYVDGEGPTYVIAPPTTDAYRPRRQKLTGIRAFGSKIVDAFNRTRDYYTDGEYGRRRRLATAGKTIGTVALGTFIAFNPTGANHTGDTDSARQASPGITAAPTHKVPDLNRSTSPSDIPGGQQSRTTADKQEDDRKPAAAHKVRMTLRHGDTIWDDAETLYEKGVYDKRYISDNDTQNIADLTRDARRLSHVTDAEARNLADGFVVTFPAKDKK